MDSRNRMPVRLKGTQWLKGGCAAVLLGSGVFCAQAAPIASENLSIGSVLNVSTALGAGGSTYNPRIYDGSYYGLIIDTPGFARYEAGSTTPNLAVNNVSSNYGHRMVSPFRGVNSTNYLLAGASLNDIANTGTFSRYDFDGSNRVDAPIPGGMTGVSSFAWTDEDTIIYSVYKPDAGRSRLYLADVSQGESFSITTNTSWNPEGYFTTSVGASPLAIRNVTVGDVYSNFAYYGVGSDNEDPEFYALNLVTLQETLLGNAGTLTGVGSFGLWTVVERDGYLYVQTTDNGIQVYNMTNGNTLGALVQTYSAEQLFALTGATKVYGFDVAPNGTMLISGGDNVVYEVVPEPGTCALIGLTALVGLFFRHRRQVEEVLS